MSVIATISVPAESFALKQTLRENPEITVRLDRVVPLGGTIIPYLWASDGDVETIENTLVGDPDVESVGVVERIDGDTLIRVEWAAGADGFADAIVTSEAQILSAIGSGEEWTFQLRFPEHDALTAFHNHCADRGVGIRLERVHSPSLPNDPGFQTALTPLQRETLVVALQEGYFSVPRETTLTELAETFGVSDTATSQRLRRGTATLIATTLAQLRQESSERVS